ncbi:MAG TPA: hypothetical protein VFM18_07385 [Methanosarcina sp.]|nr:hypothetical protein [Methanosarcina sp.]
MKRTSTARRYRNLVHSQRIVYEGVIDSDSGEKFVDVLALPKDFWTNGRLSKAYKKSLGFTKGQARRFTAFCKKSGEMA